MSLRRLLALSATLLLSGCLYHARERTDQVVAELAAHPFDLQPAAPAPIMQPADAKAGAVPPATGPALDLQTTAWMQGGPVPQPLPGGKPKIDVTIPPEIPGSEAKRIELPREPAARRREIERLYPELPPLAVEPTPEPGPGGKPYTLADLQQLAAANSPMLRQAASDVEAARGNLIQARAYPNPTVGWQVQPSNDGSTAGVQGPFIDQLIKTGGKLKLQTAAAEMDLRNAELALKRARSDLSTNVRNAYFAVLVAKETVRVNKALARFTDEIYRLQVGLLGGILAAPYEPMALRAQAYAARLAYEQSIQNHIYAWKQLVAAVGVRQLPFSEVAGRIDAAIPFYDYDVVLAHVLNNHTDVLTARNGLDKARFNLKLAQVTPVPDVDVNVALLKEFSLPPKQFVHTVTIGMPLFPLWDQNKGNIIAQEAAQVRATEEPHRVEMNLTTTLATNYNNYKVALSSLEYYRRYILPDQVRAYRGVFERRQIDPGSAFADLVTAQQALATGVSTYLTILGQLWTSVVSVADMLQTDDLFQLAQPRELPALPDLEHLTPWPCCHPGADKGAMELPHLPIMSSSGPGDFLAPHAHGTIPESLPAPATGPVQLMAPGNAPALLPGEVETLPGPRSWNAPPTTDAPWKVSMPPTPSPVEAPVISGWRSSPGTVR